MLVINCAGIEVSFQHIFVHLKEKVKDSFFQAPFTIHLCQYSGKYPRLSRGRPGFNSPTERNFFNLFWNVYLEITCKKIMYTNQKKQPIFSSTKYPVYSCLLLFHMVRDGATSYYRPSLPLTHRPLAEFQINLSTFKKLLRLQSAVTMQCTAV